MKHKNRLILPLMGLVLLAVFVAAYVELHATGYVQVATITVPGDFS